MSALPLDSDVDQLGYLTIEAAEAKNYVLPTASPFWGADAPGMKTRIFRHV